MKTLGLRQRESVARPADECLPVVADLRQCETVRATVRIQPQPHHPEPALIMTVDGQAARTFRGKRNAPCPGRPHWQDDAAVEVQSNADRLVWHHLCHKADSLRS